MTTPAMRGARSSVRALVLTGARRDDRLLLARLLARLPGVVAVGTLDRVWDAVEEDATCSCGQPVSRCPRWRAVGDLALGGWTRLHAARAGRLQRHLEHPLRAPAVAAPIIAPTRLRRRVDRFGHLASRTLHAVADVADARTLALAGTPATGPLLARAHDVDVTLVHVVRHQDPLTADRPVPDTARWLRDAAAVAAVATTVLPSVRVRVEDLHAAPAPTLRELAAVLALEAPADLVAPGGREVRLVPDHLLDDSAAARRHDVIDLTAEEHPRTRTAAPSAGRAIARSVAAPLLRAYGYEVVDLTDTDIASHGGTR